MNIKKSSARAAAAGTITTRKSTSIITSTIMTVRMKTVPAAADMSTIMMNAAAVMIMDTCRLMTAKR